MRPTEFQVSTWFLFHSNDILPLYTGSTLWHVCLHQVSWNLHTDGTFWLIIRSVDGNGFYHSLSSQSRRCRHFLFADVQNVLCALCKCKYVCVIFQPSTETKLERAATRTYTTFYGNTRFSLKINTQKTIVWLFRVFFFFGSRWGVNVDKVLTGVLFVT